MFTKKTFRMWVIQLSAIVLVVLAFNAIFAGSVGGDPEADDPLVAKTQEVVIEYHPSGRIKSLTAFGWGGFNGRKVKHGSEQHWNERGIRTLDASYRNGNRHGAYRVWNDDGGLIEEANYDDGELHGVARQWQDNGVITSETTYALGFRHGASSQFDDTGRKTESGEFYMDKGQGLWSFFGADGTVIRRHYSRGVMHGIEYYYYPDGKLFQVGANYNGKAHGPYVSFDEEGRVLSLISSAEREDDPRLLFTPEGDFITIDPD